MLKLAIKATSPLLLFICSLIAHAEHELDLLKLGHLSTQQGLNHNRVKHITEDSFGYIWITTEAGLNRFDGENITTLSTVDAPLLQQPIYASIRDHENNLWLVNAKGLIGVDAVTGKTHSILLPTTSQLSHLANWIIGVETLGDQLILISRKGVFYFSPATNDIEATNLEVILQQDDDIQAYTIHDHSLLLATKRRVYSFDLKQQTLEPIPITVVPQDFTIQGIETSQNNQLIIGGQNGLYLTALHTEEKPKLITDQSIVAMTSGEHEIYFSTNDALFEFDTALFEKRKLVSFQASKIGRSSATFTHLFLDRQKRLWLATETNGVFIWDTKTIREYLIPLPVKAPSSQSIKLFAPSSDGTLWITNTERLYHLSNRFELLGSARYKDFGVDLSRAQFFNLLSEPQNVWLYTSTGVSRYSLSEKSFKHFEFPAESKNLALNNQPLVMQEKNTLWLLRGEQLLKLDALDSTYTVPPAIKLMIGKNNLNFLTYHDQKLWLASNGILYSYSETNHTIKDVFKTSQNHTGQGFHITQTLFINDDLWISTAGDGIYHLTLKNDQPIIKHHFHTRNMFPENNIKRLLYYQNKVIAFSDIGIIKINPATGQFDPYNFSLKQPPNIPTKILGDKNKQQILSIDSRGRLKRLQLPSKHNVPLAARPIVSKISLLESGNIKVNTAINNFSAQLKKPQWLQIDLVRPPIKNRDKPGYEYWFGPESANNTHKLTQQSILLKDLPIGQSQLHIRTVDSTKMENFNSVTIDINVEPQDFFIQYQLELIYLLILTIAGVIGYKKYYSIKIFRQQFQRLKQKEERLEFALLDDRRGMWDCYINQENYLESRFIVYLNRHRPLEITLEKYFSMVHKDERALTIEAWRDFAIGAATSFSAIYRCSFYQGWIWNRIYGKANAYDKEGRPTRATGIWTDVNQEKKIEDKLNLYSHAFQSTQEIIIILDLGLNIVAVNQAYQNYTGYPSRYLIGKNMLDIVHSRFTSEETQSIKKLVERNKRWNGESSVPRRNDSSFPVDVRVNIITKDNISTGYVVVMSDISQLQKEHKTPQKSQFYDSITGLPNKALVFDHLKERINTDYKNKQPLAIVFLGIDDFDALESRLTKEDMTSLMNIFCQRLLPYVDKNDIFARYEKDIFIFIFQQQSTKSTTLNQVNLALKEVARTFVIGEHTIDISACAGISRYPEDSNNWSELITQAETALAKTKKQGRGLFAYYHQGINQKALERVALENRLSKALSAREFFLVFQPLVKIEDRKTIELDVNLRWQIEEDRIAYPSQFLPIIDDIGLLPELYDWIIDTLFSYLRRWDQEGIKIYVNLNLPLQYLTQNTAMNYLVDRLSFYHIDTQFVFLAISEQDMIQFSDNLEQLDHQLQQLGIGLLIDDFGKSDASIHNLRKMKIHSVKLDRDLIRNIESTEQDADILAGMIALINRMNMGSIAKGVENEEQLKLISGYHCRYAQGFLFGDPMNENQTRQFLLEN